MTDEWAVVVPAVRVPAPAPMQIPGALVPAEAAPVWRRAVALVLDATPFVLLGVAVAMAIQGSRVGGALWPGVFTKNVDTKSLGLPDLSLTKPLLVPQLLSLLVLTGSLLAVFAAWIAYRVGCHARWGRTGGKWLLGIAVVDAADPRRPPSLMQCVRRALVPQGAGLVPIPLTGWVPYLWVLRDPQRRGLHDKAAGTLVIVKPR